MSELTSRNFCFGAFGGAKVVADDSVCSMDTEVRTVANAHQQSMSEQVIDILSLFVPKNQVLGGRRSVLVVRSLVQRTTRGTTCHECFKEIGKKGSFLPQGSSVPFFVMSSCSYIRVELVIFRCL